MSAEIASCDFGQSDEAQPAKATPFAGGNAARCLPKSLPVISANLTRRSRQKPRLLPAETQPDVCRNRFLRFRPI
jgi:hypothetical protein